MCSRGRRPDATEKPVCTDSEPGRDARRRLHSGAPRLSVSQLLHTGEPNPYFPEAETLALPQGLFGVFLGLSLPASTDVFVMCQKRKTEQNKKAEETDSHGPASAGCGRNHRPLHPLIPGDPQGREAGKAGPSRCGVRRAVKGRLRSGQAAERGSTRQPSKADSPPAAAPGDLQDTFGGNRIGGL